MQTDRFAEYVYFWNDLIVLPVMLLLAFVLYIKGREKSVGVIAVGMFLLVISQIVSHVYKPNLSIFFITNTLVGIVGSLTTAVGSVWHFLRHRSKQANKQ